MQVKDNFVYLGFEIHVCYEVNIMQLCSFSIHKIEYVNITTPERFCTMYEIPEIPVHELYLIFDTG